MELAAPEQPASLAMYVSSKWVADAKPPARGRGKRHVDDAGDDADVQSSRRPRRGSDTPLEDRADGRGEEENAQRSLGCGSRRREREEASHRGPPPDEIAAAQEPQLEELQAARLGELEERARYGEARRAEGEELRARAATLTRRHEMHARRELLERAELLLVEAAEAEEAVARGRSRAELYLVARERARFIRDARSASVRDDEPLERISAAYARDEIGRGPSQVPDVETCRACGNRLQLVASVSLLACTFCGLSRFVLDGQVLNSCARDDFMETGITAKRVSHWVEFLRSAQARGGSAAPEGVLALVSARLSGVAAESVTPVLVRDTLRDLGLGKHYACAPTLAARISGASPPQMSALEEEKLKLMFVRACASFQHCVARGATQRTNFLSYPYTARKLCELLGLERMIPYFVRLRAAEKVTRSDAIWRCICEDVPWPFVPSGPL
jgi:hypothetical protein